MSKSLILVDPVYQKGFEGFLKAAIKNGDVVVVSGDYLQGAVNVKNFSNRLRKVLGRSALYVPNVIIINRLLVKLNISHVHIIGEPTYLSIGLVSVMKIISHKNLFITCRTAQNRIFSIPSVFKFCLYLARKADVHSFPVSVISKRFSEEFYKLPTLEVLPNGVPTEFFSVPCRISKVTNKALYVGHFIERKGFFDFLNVVAACPNIKFTAIGSLPTGKLITQEDLPMNLELKNWMNRENLISEIDDHAILIVPSKKSNGRDVPRLKRLISVPWMEQFGRIILEAYARKRRVLAYDSGAISDLIINKSDLISEGNIQDLVQRINEVVDQDDCVYEEGLKFATSYQWDKIYVDFKNRVNIRLESYY